VYAKPKKITEITIGKRRKKELRNMGQHLLAGTEVKGRERFYRGEVILA